MRLSNSSDLLLHNLYAYISVDAKKTGFEPNSKVRLTPVLLRREGAVTVLSTTPSVLSHITAFNLPPDALGLGVRIS